MKRKKKRKHCGELKIARCINTIELLTNWPHHLFPSLTNADYTKYKLPLHRNARHLSLNKKKILIIIIIKVILFPLI